MRLGVSVTRQFDAAGRSGELERLLDEFQVAHLGSSRGKVLSGGERRRVEIARALAADPSYILGKTRDGASYVARLLSKVDRNTRAVTFAPLQVET